MNAVNITFLTYAWALRRLLGIKKWVKKLIVNKLYGKISK